MLLILVIPLDYKDLCSLWEKQQSVHANARQELLQRTRPKEDVCVFLKNDLFIFTPYLPHHSHPVHWDQTRESLCRSLGSRPTPVQGHFTFAPLLFGTTSHCLSVQVPQLPPSGNVSVTLPSPHRHQHVQSHLLMLWSRFINFAVEHWFVCRATEPGYARDIGAIEYDCLCHGLGGLGEIALITSGV